MNANRVNRNQSSIFGDDQEVYHQNRQRQNMVNQNADCLRDDISGANFKKDEQRMNALRDRDDYQNTLRQLQSEEQSAQESKRFAKLKAQQELRAAYENQMAEKKQKAHTARVQNDQYAESYSQHLNQQFDAGRRNEIPRSSMDAPVDPRRVGMQDQENVYTGMQFGGMEDSRGGKDQRAREANNYHQMLDQQVAMKREAEISKKQQDAQFLQDALDHQMVQQQNADVDKRRRLTGGPAYAPQDGYSRSQVEDRTGTGANMRSIMGGEEMPQSQSHGRMAAPHMNKYSKGYNILTGN